MSAIPFRQLAPGTYDVWTGMGPNRTHAGFVYAEDGGNNVVVEHWVLLQPFASPSIQVPMEVREAPGAGYASLSAFLNDMQQHETSGALQSYIRADCFTYATLPS
mgnify:CR=1 FL=1